MEIEIYSPMEKILIESAKWLQTKQDMQKALELDLMLLQMEEEQNMMDGRELKEWIL